MRSNVATAWAMWSMVSAAVPNASLKRRRYSGTLRSRCTVASWARSAVFSLVISMGLAMGPLTCSSSDAARPSQNWSAPYTRLITDGALRPPFCPPMPLETGWASVKACAGEWQLAHETLPSDDRRGSKKSSQPNSALAGVYLLSSGHMIGTKPSGTRGPSAGNSVSVLAVTAAGWPTSVADTIWKMAHKPATTASRRKEDR